MGLAQMANYILPLAVLPYVTRVVGVANYALVEFTTVTLLYFIAIVEYSFYTTITRKIAAVAHNSKKVSFIFSNTMLARALLFGAALTLFSLCMLLIPGFRENQIILWLAFPIVLGWVLYPNFLFQGVQKLKVVALANVAVKGIAALLIFVFVHEKEDFVLVTFINGIAQLVVGAFTFFYAFVALKNLAWVRPKIKAVKAILWEGRHVFISNFFTRVYGFSTVFLGFFILKEQQLGLFAVSAKLISVCQSFLFQPLYGALFPYLSQLFAKDFEAYKKAFKKSLLLLVSATVLATLVLGFSANFAIQLIFGQSYQGAGRVLLIMSPILIIGAFVHMHMQQGLLILKRDKVYMKIVIAAGLASIGLNLLLVPLFDLTGAALVKVAIELVIAILATKLYYHYLNKVNAAG
jgi:PST family polysaccharide transporter